MRAYKRARLAAVLVGLALVLVFTGIIALMVGPLGPIGPGEPERISFQAFFDILSGRGSGWPESYHAVLIDIRLPRILLAALVGCALSMSGTTMQALFRNPMADPFILGISSGAAVGASVSVLFHLDLTNGIYILPLLAFVGATATVFGVCAIARGTGGRMKVETLLLAGIAVSSFLSAVVALMMYASAQHFRFLFFWLLGGLTTASWEVVFVASVPIVSGIVVLHLFERDLNAMTLGEEPAMHLGIDVETLKKIIIVIVALLAGTAVAFSGIIGFVGLIVPHMARHVVGPSHRILLPVATLTGGIFLISADTVSRTALGGTGTEIPVGIITALCGAPFFIFLLWRSKRRKIL
jgi:iron complex transport system permease protein